MEKIQESVFKAFVGVCDFGIEAEYRLTILFKPRKLSGAIVEARLLKYLQGLLTMQA